MKQIQKNKRTNSIPMGSALAWNFNTIFNFMEAFINKGYAAFLSALLVTITSHHRLSLTQINSITNWKRSKITLASIDHQRFWNINFQALWQYGFADIH